MFTKPTTDPYAEYMHYCQLCLFSLKYIQKARVNLDVGICTGFRDRNLAEDVNFIGGN
jgi:hypothetical protein